MVHYTQKNGQWVNTETGELMPDDITPKPEGYYKAPEKDNINPDHYKVGGIETWDYMKAKLTPTELAGAVKFNVIKYLSRANHKGKVEDLKKAKWYLDNLIKEIENG